jgi:hypothetical protein
MRRKPNTRDYPKPRFQDGGPVGPIRPAAPGTARNFIEGAPFRTVALGLMRSSLEPRAMGPDAPPITADQTHKHCTAS